MWFDPNTGKFIWEPGEKEKGLHDIDPLLVKALFSPQDLTPEENQEVALKLVSFCGDFMSKKELRDLLEELRVNPQGPLSSCGTDLDRAAEQMIEGKLALREMGAAKQRYLELGRRNAAGEIVPFTSPQQTKTSRKRKAAKTKPVAAKPEKGKVKKAKVTKAVGRAKRKPKG